jgi:hypothetical protein
MKNVSEMTYGEEQVLLAGLILWFWGSVTICVFWGGWYALGWFVGIPVLDVLIDQGRARIVKMRNRSRL